MFAHYAKLKTCHHGQTDESHKIQVDEITWLKLTTVLISTCFLIVRNLQEVVIK